MPDFDFRHSGGFADFCGLLRTLFDPSRVANWQLCQPLRPTFRQLAKSGQPLLACRDGEQDAQMLDISAQRYLFYDGRLQLIAQHQNELVFSGDR